MSTEVEAAAKEMGWVPKENFRGPPEKWIDAEAFVERGEQILPILKANNHKLTDKLSRVESELAENRALLAAATESIEALKEFNNKTTLREVKESRKELTTALVEARKEGDVARELEINDQLAATTEAIREAEKLAETKPVVRTPPANDPDWSAFIRENPWYGQDKLKSNFAIAAARTLREDPANAGLKGKAFLDKVAEQIAEAFPNPSRRGNGKVEEGRPSGGSGSDGGKTYSDLPPEAKAACDADAKRLVGKGRAFADLAAWRSAYTKKYFEE